MNARGVCACLWSLQICVQGSMGQGKFTAMPLQLSVRKTQLAARAASPWHHATATMTTVRARPVRDVSVLCPDRGSAAFST